MQKFKQIIFYIVLPIVLIFGVAILYKKIICHIGSASLDASFICEFKWKDGFILLSSYGVVKGLSPVLGFDTILKRIFITIGLYCFAYAIIAWPFLIASFFQPFLVNVFIHGILLIIIIELLFSRFGSYPSNQKQ